MAFDGANFLVVWEDERSGGSDIYGARVTPGGTVYDEGPVVRQEGNQWYLALARGTGSQMLLVYQGWAGTVGGKTYNIDRIWSKMNPSPGIEEQSQEPIGNRQEPMATIVRGVLVLNGLGTQSQSPGRDWVMSRAVLLDSGGRKVLDLMPGPNDVSRLAPGVYFVREQALGYSQRSDSPLAPSSVTKVVIGR